METCLIILLFFPGAAPFLPSIPRKYYLIQQGTTWSNAQAYCRASYTDLAIIQSKANLARLQNEIQTQQFNSNAWIGLYNDVNSWRWSLGNQPLGSLRQWWPGEPDNWKGHEECALIDPSGWSDGFCTNLASFVCFDGNRSGNQRYIYISQTKTWQDAQTYCRTYHTDLTSARDTTENSVIKGLTSGMTWFGLFRDAWKWTDRTKFSTDIISWVSGKPSNALGNENCASLNTMQMSDEQCSNLLPFFCHRVVTGKQIIRVKIQTKQDVNSLSIKVAILEKIKQILSDNGMPKNIAVKWREQPDGKVFH